MSIRFDEKGKFFTEVILKETVWAVIQTVTHRILGHIHVAPEKRLKDELNQSEQFLAVTDAVIYDSTGAELYRSDFMALNLDHVIWMIPHQQTGEESELVGGEA